MGIRLLVPVGLINLGLAALMPWGAYLSIFLDAYVADMLFMCSQDPPAVPDMSNFNPFDLLGGIYNPLFKPAQQKLQAAFENWFWYHYCFCSTGSLTQPAPISIPPPLAQSVSSSNNVTPCFSGGWAGFPPSGPDQGGSIGDELDVTLQTLPVGPGRHQFTNIGTPFTAYQVPAGVSNIRATGITRNKTGSPFPNGSLADFFVWDSNFTLIDEFSFWDNTTYHNNFDITHPIIANAAWWRMSVFAPVSLFGTPPTEPLQFNDQVYCGSSPLSLESCCPPDPQIASMLQSILVSIGQIPSAGGLPVGSYVDSTVHANLTGLGTIPIESHTLAVRAVIVQDNNQLPVGVGNPPYLFDRGFIVPTVSRGAVRGNVRLSYNPQLYVLPQFTEQIGYTLANGLIVDLTELIAGP